MSAEICGNFKLLSEVTFTESMKDSNGESILVHNTGSEDPNRLIIFSKNQLIEFAKNSTEFQMDGTFKLCPRVYNNGVTSNGQLYSMHAKKDGTLVPCFYI